jgi:hypothetical protein
MKSITKTLIASALCTLFLSGCVTPTATERPAAAFRYTDFHSVYLTVRQTAQTEKGSDETDVEYAQEATDIFASLLGAKLKALGYQLVDTPASADLLIDIPIDEAKPGSTAARVLIGFGAGRAAFKFTAHFSRRGGESLGSFSGGRLYTGLEMNQSGFPGHDELATRAATRSAEEVVSYLQSGGALQENGATQRPVARQ